MSGQGARADDRLQILWPGCGGRYGSSPAPTLSPLYPHCVHVMKVPGDWSSLGATGSSSDDRMSPDRLERQQGSFLSESSHQLRH